MTQTPDSSAHPGDSGQTYVPAAGRVPKNHPLLHACGALDELNSVLGTVRSAPGAEDPWLDDLLAACQSSLFTIGAAVAGLTAPRPAEPDPSAMDRLIEEIRADLRPLRSFILPAGGERAARLHHARAVCRRAERWIVAAEADVPETAAVVPWINRLSLLLFELARRANAVEGIAEDHWPTQRGP